MPKLSEDVLRQLISGGETTTVALKRASPRPARWLRGSVEWRIHRVILLLLGLKTLI